MLKQRREAAEDVKAALDLAKASFAASQVAAANLITVTRSREAELNLGPLVTREALSSASAALGAASLGLDHMYESHRYFAVSKARIGLDAVSFGDEDSFPPAKKAEAEETAPAHRRIAVVG